MPSRFTFARLTLVAAAFAGLSVACSAEVVGDGTEAASDEDAIKGTNCEATFTWLQKDAYKETAGRTSKLWPPHTTTTLEASCTTKAAGKQSIGSAFQANYGTEPGAKDKNGDVMLVEVKRETVRGSKDAMQRLLTTYKTCGCNPKQFLSMDKLKGEVGEKLLGDVVKTIEANAGLTCTNTGGKEALVAALKAQEFEKAIAIVPQCSFEGGDLAATLDKALGEVAKTSSTTLADYHVCNNDAVLQAELVASFDETGKVVACDAAVDACRGPLWFYVP